MDIKIVVTKAILLYKNNSVLYFLELTRSPRKKFPFMGDLPGGTVEQNESPLTGIQREVKEETGIILPKLELLTVYDWGESQEYREYLYCAMVNTQEVILAPEEHVDYRWIELDKIGESTLHSNVKKIIEHEKVNILNLVEKI